MSVDGVMVVWVSVPVVSSGADVGVSASGGCISIELFVKDMNSYHFLWSVCIVLVHTILMAV